MANVKKPSPRTATPVAPVVAKAPAPVAAAVPAAPAKAPEILPPAAPAAAFKAKAPELPPAAHDAREQVRKAFEDGINQSRAAYEKLRVAAESATGTLEASYSAATKGMNTLNAKAIDAIKANSEASLDHVKSVMAAKTFGEAVALQSAHARRQFDALAAQGKDFAESFRQIARESFEPFTTGFEKGLAR
jgi:phasin